MFFKLIILIFLASCGITQRQEVGGDAELTINIVIHFPTCDRIIDEDKIVECVAAHTKFLISVGGIESLTDEQLEIIEKLGIEKEELISNGEENDSTIE